MEPYILMLDDPRASLDTTGGKGASLTRMINAGLPVPNGFHITTAAYRSFVDLNDLQPQIAAAVASSRVDNPAALDSASAAISRLFENGVIPAAVAAAVVEAYSALGDLPVAVRSSATAEDLPDASFAGQQETYLNIQGTEAVMQAVKKCWASLWTPRAIAYRIKNEIDQDAVALAVVVQKLVFADAAGILFTANPINGKRSELVINASWGLGEAVVSGAVTPDTLVVDKIKRRVIRREIAEKKLMTVRTRNGTEERPVPADRQKKAALNRAQAMELGQLGINIEQFYGMPMDVEWALAGGTFAILQARPITALPVEWIAPDPRALYARGSLAEHTPSPVTPLFATLGLELANEATVRMWKRIVGKNYTAIMPADGMYAPINGYVFGGVRVSVIEILKVSLSQLRPMFKGSVARWQAARSEFSGVVEAWERKPISSLTPSELMQGIRAVFLAACEYFTHIQTTLPAASSSEVMFTRLYNSLIRRKGDPEASVFLLGFETMALKYEKSLFDLAEWTRNHPPLADYILHTGTDALTSGIENEGTGLEPVEHWNEWRQRFGQHLETYGQTAYEFDFANPTPLETPGPMIDALKSYLNGTSSSPYLRQQEAERKRALATRTVLNRTHWPLKGWFRRLLAWAQETNPMREDSIFDMGMGHPLLRRMFSELAQRFTTAGAIDYPQDIYWLEQEEVNLLVTALESGSSLPYLSDRIPQRRQQWQAAFKYAIPVMLPEKSRWSKLVHGGAAERKDGKIVLRGVGTSSGTVTAPACVIYGPEDFGKLHSGDVLVAVTTTPAWTPLFAIASAVITDIGGPLSHSSIVAREYGIPAVMAVRTGTHVIQTGQIITVDGAAGTVTLEQLQEVVTD